MNIKNYKHFIENMSSVKLFNRWTVFYTIAVR